MARMMAVEYFLGLDLRCSGLGSPPVFPPSPPSSPSPSREGGLPPPLPRMSSMISSMSSITDVPGIRALASSAEIRQTFGQKLLRQEV